MLLLVREDRWLRGAALMLGLLVGGCLGGGGGGQSGDDEDCQGGERCACYRNDTCDDDLECLSGICVDTSGESSEATDATDSESSSSDDETESGGVTDETDPEADGTDSPASSGEDDEAPDGGSPAAPNAPGEDCASGARGCACYGNGTCDDDLVCRSDVCVADDGSGATDDPPEDTDEATDSVSDGTDPEVTPTDDGSSETDPAPDEPEPVSTPIELIDDFGDCDGQVIEIDGRKGAWYNLNDDTDFSVGEPPASTWVDQSCGVFATGMCPGCDVAGVAVILSAGVYDLTPYSGIEVTFESEATLFVAVKTTDGQDYSYAWSSGITGTGTGGTRTIYFDDLDPDADFHGFEWAQEIHFTVSDYDKEYGFGLGIHRLELF